MYTLDAMDMSEISSIIAELHKASNTHKKQAHRLQAIYDRCTGVEAPNVPPGAPHMRPVKEHGHKKHHMKSPYGKPLHHGEEDIITIIALYADE